MHQSACKLVKAAARSGTGQSLKKIEDALERDYFLTAEAAKDFGLVDKVIERRTEEMLPKSA